MPIRTGEYAVQPIRQAKPVCPHELIPFIKKAPLPVMVRSCLEWLVQKATLEQLFDVTAEAQYKRELTLTFLVETMLDVVCGIHPSAGAAYRAHREQAGATRQAFYRKLDRMEPAVAGAVVHAIAGLARQVMTQLGALRREPIDGLHLHVLDGTQLGGRTDHRIEPLRAIGSAGLTGRALAVYEPALQLVTQVVLAEDAYTQERAMLSGLQIEPGDLWVADRHFCVRTFLFTLHRAQAAFIIRWHANACPFQEIEPPHRAKGSKHTKEHRVWIEDPVTHEWLMVRRIIMPLARPTKNGDTELILLTNLPDTIAADRICAIYHDRWQIEVHFNRLTQQLHGEPPGLNYPRAALFAFCMAITAANALAVVLKALEVKHGREAVEELSYYYLVLEIVQIWHGMALIVPTEEWEFVRRLPIAPFAKWLRDLATAVPMDRFRRSRRKASKPPPKKSSGRQHKHVSNQRLLEKAQICSG